MVDEFEKSGVTLNDKKVFDLSTSATDYERCQEAGVNSKEFIKCLLSLCERDPVRIGMMDIMHQGLIEILNMNSDRDISKAADKLIMRSSEALRTEVLSGGGDTPVVSKRREHKLWIERQNNYSTDYNLLCTKRWSLKVKEPKAAVVRWPSDVISIVKDLFQSPDLDEAIKIMREKRLIFVRKNNVSGKLKTSESGQHVITYRFELYDMDQGSVEEMKQMLRKILESRHF